MPTIAEVIILPAMGLVLRYSTKIYIPMVFKIMLPIHTIKYLKLCFLIEPFLALKTQFLFKMKAVIPPDTAPIIVAAIYHMPNPFDNNTKTEKSTKVAKRETKLYLKNAIND